VEAGPLHRLHSAVAEATTAPPPSPDVLRSSHPREHCIDDVCTPGMGGGKTPFGWPSTLAKGSHTAHWCRGVMHSGTPPRCRHHTALVDASIKALPSMMVLGAGVVGGDVCVEPGAGSPRMNK